MDAEAPRDGKLEQALKAAQLYYMQDRTMEAIARELGTSRSSVSRLLSHARETGLVDIRITSPLERGGFLEQRVRERFHVAAHVVPVPSSVSEVDRLERVAMTAARLFAQFVDSNMVVGVAWGSTLTAVSRYLPQKETHGTTIVQLNGAGNTQTTGVDYSSEVLQRFGDAFGAKLQQFPVPAFFDDPATREAMWRERSTRRVLDVQGRMDVALFSLGSPSAEVPSRVYVGGYLDRDDYRSLTEDRVIGDVATVFFRADGTWRDVRLNARATGPDLDRLRRVPRRVCVVAGAHKLASLRAALTAGLVTDVVLDETLAERLVETL
ncbi:sugar-binding domain-containing protein [Microbacterium oryzae]|uniref:sugar-binding transcriptional regulator n=1 Tax=Microbacterium oryzae TaxID=743009 RepID=UPI0025B07BBF|nr:sugar-binding domain-containing protein [Microbacterium oryzae]MDN3310565.1 sugar-binding domain-containing protein [Microbacterium oryzae]